MAPKKTNTDADPSKVSPLNLAARRQYMESFFRQLPITKDVIEQARTKAIELQSKHLAGRGLSDVNVVYFEYHVDVTVWRLIMNLLMITKSNPWPWKVSIDENNLSDGTSPIFREWCRSHRSSAEAQGSASGTSQSPAQPQPPQHQAPVASAAPQPSVASGTPQPPVQQTLPSVGSGSNEAWTVSRRPPTSSKTAAPAASVARIAGLGEELSKLTVKSSPKATPKEPVEEKASPEAVTVPQPPVDATLAAKREVAQTLFDGEMKRQGQKCLLPGIQQSRWATSDGQQPLPYITSFDPQVQIRGDYGARNHEDIEEPRLPSLALREKIWQSVCKGMPWLSGPLCGPFELALPAWLDFHDLVCQDFERIQAEKLLDEDIVIAWRVSGKRPVSLVIGPNPAEIHSHEDIRFWIQVRNNWWRVAWWLSSAYWGSSIRLVEHLREVRDLACEGQLIDVPASMTRLFEAWGDIMSDPLLARNKASWNRNNMEMWVPQIHAILAQPRNTVGSLLDEWVFRDMPNANIRAQGVRDAWSRVAPVDAISWHQNAMLKLRSMLQQ
ncbi:hypothetical protein CEK26_010623 [Fusarium fujikuroi]|nr:Uncharacterized protein LW94_1914 [Fusarium fujikuroi]QGI66664.1 hypothetical protein CEK27_010635 [Fusarium fujikuroi]QGI83902.1 hypothetical protein CEK25_010631 [Fusarium fujikuroi]QGI97554.1 hypothetical protein CEK26_010623 [Fusarium fujikuroi]SCO52990.1 uncharacterized protein FFMR_11309 [Fusarium fujikuroi]